jgi:V8-like Glu-specific endopeptidase
MKKNLLKFWLFFCILILFLTFGSSSMVFGQESTSSTEQYQFTTADETFLVEPAVCYITSVWAAYVYDPAVGDWSDVYYYGPFGGTGFVVNPETGTIVTAGHMVDVSYVDLKKDILDQYIANTYPDDYYDLSESDWNTIYDKFKVEGQNKADPDREVWVQFNTTTANVPDNPDNTYISAEVIKVSPWEQRDIAVIKITPVTGRALSSAIIGDSSMVEIGDSVTIIGYPWTSDIGTDNPLNPTVTKGTISGRVMLAGTEVLQIQGDARPGNSGSPVLGKDGSIIGILTMSTDETNNYLRPANDIKLMLDVENKLGQVDEEWKTGLAMYRQSHFSEAIKHFDAVLNLSAGHLLAQEYKAKAQTNMGSDVPLTVETTAPETTAEITAANTVTETTAPPIKKIFGLTITLAIIIAAAALVVAVVIIIVITLLVRRKNRQRVIPSTPQPVITTEVIEAEEHPAIEDVEEVKPKQIESKSVIKFCPKCGEKVTKNQIFCPNCGNKLK